MKQLTFEQLQKFASTLDGYCLELNGKRAIWQCKFGHKWEAHYGGRIRHWCSICSKNKKLTLDDAKTLAIKNNGECLSDVYENSTKKLIWKCEFGHIWKTTYSSINSGSWCAKCTCRASSLAVCGYFSPATMRSHSVASRRAVSRASAVQT